MRLALNCRMRFFSILTQAEGRVEPLCKVASRSRDSLHQLLPVYALKSKSSRTELEKLLRFFDNDLYEVALSKTR